MFLNLLLSQQSVQQLRFTFFLAIVFSNFLESWIDDFISFQSRNGNIETPEEDKNCCWNGLEDFRSAKLTANSWTSSEHQDSNSEKSLNTEDGDRESQAANGHFEDLSLGLPVDSSHGPGDTNSKEDVDSVGASDVTDRGVSSFILNSSCLWSKCIRYAGAECNKGDCINAVFETDEAAEMASDISNDSRAAADEEDWKDECGIAIIDSYIVKNLSLWCSKTSINYWVLKPDDKVNDLVRLI